MDAVRNLRTVNVSSAQRPLRTAHAKALLSMQPGGSFTIPNDQRLRDKVRAAAHYWRIPITSRTVSPNEIQIWRVEDKPIDPLPIAVTRKVPPVKQISAVEIALLREAKAKSMRQSESDRVHEVEIVNNEQHTITLVIVEKKSRPARAKRPA